VRSFPNDQLWPICLFHILMNKFTFNLKTESWAFHLLHVIIQLKAIESNTFKFINTALTLKNIFQDNQHTLITPMSMFDSFYLSKELKPMELDSVQYLVRLIIFNNFSILFAE